MSQLPVLLQEFRATAVCELLINSTRSVDRVFADRRVVAPSPFAEAAALTRDLQRFAHERGARLDPLHPYAGGELRLANDLLLRWHFLIPPASFDGPVASFRRHHFQTLGLEHFAITPTVRRRLEQALHGAERPVFFAGPTGSGKTTLLVSLLSELLKGERVIFFESVPEIPLLSPLWVRFVARPRNQEGAGEIKLLALVQEALRVRPDRFVLAELRGDEAQALYYLWTSGHKGVVATIHLGSAGQLLPKLAQLSPDLRSEWRELFNELRPLVVLMDRSHPPRVKALFSYTGETFEEWI